MTFEKFSPNQSIRRYGSLLLVVLGVSVPWAGGNDTIAISATIAPDYVRPIAADGHPRPETYICTQGHFLGGNVVDTQLEKKPFTAVLQTLAPALAKQNYLPTKDTAAADLLIVVHWGVTDSYEDPRGKQFAIEAMNEQIAAVNASVAETGMADTGQLNHSLALRDGSAGSQDSVINRNAVLLGYYQGLAKERASTLPTADELAMSVELNEERYFVVLMAYDYQYFRKEHRSKLRWITRLSIRSPGNNFNTALPALASAGAELFGRQSDGLIKVKPGSPEARVKLGEIEYLGTVEGDKPTKPAVK